MSRTRCPWRVALPGEPLVEHEVVLLRLAGELAPDDQRPAAIGRRAGDGAEPVGPSASCFRRPLRRSRPSRVALEFGGEGLRRGMCLTVRPISQLKVSSRSTLTSRLSSEPGTLDLQLVGRRIGERLHVEQATGCRASRHRACSAACTARLGRPRPAPRVAREAAAASGAAALQVVERVLVGFQSDHLNDSRDCARPPQRAQGASAFHPSIPA
jgi:hypothetical protein